MTARLRLSTRDRVNCFSDADGKCHICGEKIAAGERWEVSHPIPLAMGGEDVASNRRPAHYRCHRTLTAQEDMPRIAKTCRGLPRHAEDCQDEAPARQAHRGLQGFEADAWFPAVELAKALQPPGGEAHMSAAEVLRYLPAMGCVVIAAVLAFAKRDGWGWFLFFAIVLAPA